MRVLIATDGSEYSYEAARQYVKLTHGARHQIKALYVIPSITVGRDTGYFEIEQQREGLTALRTVERIFADVSVPVEAELRQGNPADTILQIAREGGYELIVIGRRGRGGFREMLLGSVTKTIVHNTPCSLLIGR